MDPIKSILEGTDEQKKKELFSFTISTDNALVGLKFRLWATYFFPQYFKSKDAKFHKKIDGGNILMYRGSKTAFVDIAFRGASKTARTKLFLAYCILNDLDHHRRYVKVLSADDTNSKQIVVDIYNMFVHPKVAAMYPDTFEKSSFKREEKMETFTTAFGVKVIADTVGTAQRGALQEESRPDLILFEDFEDRLTLYSAKKTRMIWANMEEARTGLAVGGSCIYNCNYISELGNVHKLVEKAKNSPETQELLIQPIMDKMTLELAWPERYTLQLIEQMKKDDEDFEGERMCEPSASKDILFDREKLDAMVPKQPVRESGQFRIFKEYDPTHRYGSGHDVAGGLGLDSSTSVFIDFSCVPAKVVGVFHSNTIKPESFGYEVKREQDMFGGCISAIENNKYDSAVLAASIQGANLYGRDRSKDSHVDSRGLKELGWSTNPLTKPTMILALAKAVEDGLLDLVYEPLIRELKSYSRNDLIDKEEDPRMTTRHFDLVIALAIAWQMNNHATVFSPKEDWSSLNEAIDDYSPFSDIGF